MKLTYLDELRDALRSFCFRGVWSPRLGRNRYDRCAPDPGTETGPLRIELGPSEDRVRPP